MVDREPLLVRTVLGDFTPRHPTGVVVNKQVSLLFRPTGAKLAIATNGINSLSGKVEDVAFRGESYRVTLRAVDGTIFQFSLADPLPLHEQVTLAVLPDEIIVLK